MTPPHKPLFLLTGLWACLPPVVWLWPGVLLDPVFWHMHELFFGMASAAIGTYLLTALPHWTGQRSGPMVLWVLIIAWIVGRCAQVLDTLQTSVLVGSALAYPMTMAVVLLRPVLRAQAWRKAWMATLPLGLGAADAALLLAHRRDTVPAAAPYLIALAFALVIGLIGGRIVPAFTQSRITQRTGTKMLRSGKIPGGLAAAATILAMLGLAAEVVPSWGGWALMLAGVLQTVRLVGWQSWAIKGQPDILMLHLAWAWLAAGFGLFGAALVWPQDMLKTASIHALTMGAMGSMIFAIAARAFMTREAGRLVVTADLAAGFALISAAAALRVFLPDRQALGYSGIQWAALFWSSAWALFVGRILHSWPRPVPFPILSADQGGRVRRPSSPIL